MWLRSRPLRSQAASECHPSCSLQTGMESYHPPQNPVAVCSVSKGTARGAALKRAISATPARSPFVENTARPFDLGTLKKDRPSPSPVKFKVPVLASSKLPLDQGGPTSGSLSAQHGDETSLLLPAPLTNEWHDREASWTLWSPTNRAGGPVTSRSLAGTNLFPDWGLGCVVMQRQPWSRRAPASRTP